MWQCQSCHFQTNWACRVRCRECDSSAPMAVKQRASEQNDKALLAKKAATVKRVDLQPKINAGKPEENKDKSELQRLEKDVDMGKHFVDMCETLGYDTDRAKADLAAKQTLLDEAKVKETAGKPVYAYHLDKAIKALAKGRKEHSTFGPKREASQQTIDKETEAIAQSHIDELASSEKVAALEAEVQRLNAAITAAAEGRNGEGQAAQSESDKFMAACNACCVPGAQKEFDELQEYVKKFWARNEELKMEEAARKHHSDAA